MDYIYSLVNHLKPIKKWADFNCAKIEINANTIHLTVSLGKGIRTFIPRFLKFIPGGKIAYTTAFEDTGVFVGWLPYEVRRWPIASDKIVFKRYCQQIGLPVPKMWVRDEIPECDYIIKTRFGSFGSGQKGPFRVQERSDFSNIELTENEFIEKFVPGSSVKIWFWGKTPVAMVENQPPYLVGDGKSSLANIAASVRFNFDTKHTLDKSVQILAWQGYDLNTILPKGATAQIDYQHTSAYAPSCFYGYRDLYADQSEEIKEFLIRCGELFSAAVPDEYKEGVIYTVDAVREGGSGNIYLLELNCNPMVHPGAYQKMLDSLFYANKI